MFCYNPRMDRDTAQLGIGCCGLGLFCILVYSFANWFVQSHTPKPEPQRVFNYQKNRICKDAMDTHLDYSQSQLSHIEVKLVEGCWSGWFTIPSWWDVMYVQLDEPDDWISGWFSGSQQRGPFTMKDNINLAPMYNRPNNTLRLQGHGIAKFYVNVKK